jgi:hypothetical protein
MQMFNEGDQVKYVLGRTSSDKDITAKHPSTFVRYNGTRIDADGAEGERAIVRTNPNEFTRPNVEEEVWVARLRMA